MPDGAWSLAEAEAKFGEVVERARTEGPQRLTHDGEDAVVILSAQDYRRLSGEGGAAEPAANWLDARFQILSDEEHDAVFVRDKDPGRVIEF